MNLPRFLSNRPDLDQSVADGIGELFSAIRQQFAHAPELSIATAYINPGGFSLLADELEHAPRVRLLLGAEPLHNAELAQQVADPQLQHRIDDALSSHEAWLESERDLTGFSREARDSIKAFVEWLERQADDGAPRVEVRRYTHGFLHGKAFILNNPVIPRVVAGSSNMTYAGLSTNAELNLVGDEHHTAETVKWFEHYWHESEPYDLVGLYRDLWVPHSPWDVFMRMLLELYGAELSEEVAESAFNLAGFQVDGVARMKRILADLGGVLVADEVGLGKSFLAGAVVKEATEERKQRALIIAPAAIKASMWDPFIERYNFNRLVKVMSYEQVRNRMDPEDPHYADFHAYTEELSMVVVDEAHNLRSASAERSKALDRVILSGSRPKQVVLLTATPVNNSLHDLDTLLRYFIRNDAQFASIGIPSIRKYIDQAQSIDPDALTPEHLFDLMDQVAVKRTRRFVQKFYANDEIYNSAGEPVPLEFPEPHTRRIDYTLEGQSLELVDRVLEALEVDGDEEGSIERYRDRQANEKRLMLARYTPSRYSTDNHLDQSQISNAGLLRSALLKRLESSPSALESTLARMIASHEAFLSALKEGFVLTGGALSEWGGSESDDLDEFLDELDDRLLESAEPLGNFYGEDLIADVETDIVLLKELRDTAARAAVSADGKFDELIGELGRIAEAARKEDPSRRGVSSGDRRKVIIFSTFSDTVDDLHGKLAAYLESNPDGAIADYIGRLAEPIMGTSRPGLQKGVSGGVDQGGRANQVRHFAPKFAGGGAFGVDAEDLYDLLVTTDVLAEGVNLQQAGHIINYDLPWNPMRIVQRHGRIDRIGSPHSTVQLGLYFPAERLEEMLQLEQRLKAKVARAEAAIGTTISVLSNKESPDVILADPASVEHINDLLVNRGHSVAQSGEELRRRLHKFMEENRTKGARMKHLPLGIGSGFASDRIRQSGYVFCVRIANSDRPWFRFLPADAEWKAIIDDAGEPQINSDMLTALIAADPGHQSAERDLSAEAFEGAFDAWSVVQESIFRDWMRLVDPKNLEPEVPAAFRDAAQFLKDHGQSLEPEVFKSVFSRLNSVPSTPVARRMRKALKAEQPPREKISGIIQVLDDAGIQEAPEIKGLSPISLNQVQLVAWMAVKAG